MTLRFPAAPVAAGLPAMQKLHPWVGGLSPRVPQHPLLFAATSPAMRARGSRRVLYSQSRYVSCRDLKTCCSSKASFDFTVTSSSETHSYYTAE